MTNLRCISFSLDYCNLGTVCVTRPEGVLSCGINSGNPAAKQQVSSACDVLSKVTNVPLRSSGHASVTRLVSPILAAAQSSTLFWFLLFIFYLPPLPNGPIVCFSDFVAQVCACVHIQWMLKHLFTSKCCHLGCVNIPLSERSLSIIISPNCTIIMEYALFNSWLWYNLGPFTSCTWNWQDFKPCRTVHTSI